MAGAAGARCPTIPAPRRPLLLASHAPPRLMPVLRHATSCVGAMWHNRELPKSMHSIIHCTAAQLHEIVSDHNMITSPRAIRTDWSGRIIPAGAIAMATSTAAAF